jgi:hypothetical protein
MKENNRLESIVKDFSEKERLELIEKRLEIQKKRLDIKKERFSINKFAVETEKEQLDLAVKKVEIRSKQLENKKLKLDLEDIYHQRISNEIHLVSNKIFSVLFPLMVSTIDDERTILGSEPFYKPLLTGKHKDKAMNKLMELINQL